VPARDAARPARRSGLRFSARRRALQRHRYSLRAIREVRISAVAAASALRELLFSNDLTHSAAIAYYALLSLFPFLLLMVSLFGTLAADDTARAEVLSFIFRYFPTRFDFLVQQLDAFRQHPVGLSVTGALGLVWGSLGVFGALTSAINEAWGVTKPRGFWKHRLASFLLFLAATGAMLLGLFLVSASHIVSSNVGFDLSNVWWIAFIRSLALQYLATILFIVAVGLLYYLVPNERARFRDVWVGAIFTGVLWRGGFELFSWMTSRNAQLQVVNGSIAVVVLFLMWVYVSSVILMYGVEFTAAHYRARRHPPAAVTGG
jgi:YihY family inner membrane protein